MAKIELAPGMPAHEVLALVKARKATKAQAIAYLQARVDAHVAAGRKPRWATRKALADLRGQDAPEALPEGLATLSQAAKARKAEPKAPKAKAAKAKAPAKAPAKTRKAAPKAQDALTAAANALAQLDEVQLAAFLKQVLDARAKA